MKIISWNVNGLRAIMGKDFPSTIKELDPDILFLQETKLSDPSFFPFTPDGYHLYWTISKTRKGYSGVAFLSKIEPLSVHYGLENGEYDDEGRTITLEFPSFYLVGCYVPNSGDGLKRLDFRMKFEDDMANYLSSLAKKKPVIYTGDLNVAHNPIDLKNPESNTMNPGFTKEERGKMDELLASGLIDTYRTLYPEKIEYSWWSYRFHAREKGIGWRIDYFLASPSLLPQIEDSLILCDVMGSDHCPVMLKLRMS